MKPDSTIKLPNVDMPLRRERQHADQTIREERARADATTPKSAIDQGMDGKEQLSVERHHTDRELAYQRLQTDIDRDNSAAMLAKERSAHQDTRAELTSRDEFLAIVSHDLRNPLGTISMAANILLDKDLPEEAKQMAEMIQRNVEVALRLISDILDMERISTGKLDIRATNTNISDLINNSIKAQSHLAASKSIAIRFMAPDSPVKGYCDPDRIMQVLLNLIDNAIKFTPNEGTITITAKAREHDIQVSVTDTGIGISPDMTEAIFERFSQLHKHDRRGLGLGLFITRQIILSHGGTLKVMSHVGQGSTFAFALPLEGFQQAFNE